MCIGKGVSREYHEVCRDEPSIGTWNQQEESCFADYHKRQTSFSIPKNTTFYDTAQDLRLVKQFFSSKRPPTMFWNRNKSLMSSPFA